MKQLLLAVVALFTIAMVGKPARACTCGIGVGLVGESVRADGGVVLKWNGFWPALFETAVLRGPTGESLEFAAKSWESGRVCGPGFSVLTPKAPLVVGAKYELSVPRDKPDEYSVVFTVAEGISGDDPTPTLEFERVEHRTQRGDLGTTCYFTHVPQSVTWDHTALVKVSAPGALDGRFIAVARADNAPHESWVDAASLGGGDDVATLQLPLPDAAACMNVEVWNAQGESVLAVALCQPDRCWRAESWNYTAIWDSPDHPSPTTSTTCELPPDPVEDAGPEPVEDAGPEPAPEAGPEPTADAASEPTADSAAEPAADTSAEPVAEPATASADTGSGCNAATTPPIGLALLLLVALASRRRSPGGRGRMHSILIL